MSNTKNYLFNFFYLKLEKFIKKGDTIYLESDLLNLVIYFQKKNFKFPLRFFFNLLLKLIGKKGTLILPSFTYSWGKGKIKDKIFDKKKTKCSTGIFPEYVRNNMKIVRTNDPMFSFLIFGRNKNKFVKISNNSFGKNSLFEKINNEKTKLISFGLNKFDPTFVHYVEQYFNDNFKKILYRKSFRLRGFYRIFKRKTKGEFNCFLKIKNSKYTYSEKNIKKVLLRKKKLVSFNILNNTIFIVKAQDFFFEGIKGMKKNTKFFTDKV